MNKDIFFSAINNFNDGQYFECHEELESLWKELEVKDLEKISLQIIIQCAVAIYLTKSKKQIGANKVLIRAKNNLRKHSKNFYGIDLKKLVLEVDKYISNPSTDLIPKIKFIN